MNGVSETIIRMVIPRAAGLVAMMLAIASASAPVTAAEDSFAEPGVSRDGSEVAFVCGGNVWSVPAGGGEGRLLVSQNASISRPTYSPYGRRLAFLSNKTGGVELYVLEFDTGRVKRLTYGDAPEELDGWSPDGQWIYFATSEHEVGKASDIYRVSPAGGTPTAVIADGYSNSFGAAPHPDGTTLAFCNGGLAARSWWRKGHSHLDEAQIWLMRRPAGTASFQRITDYDAKDLWPIWDPAGKVIYFISDRDGTENVWSVVPGRKPRQLTGFTSGRVIWPALSADGSTLVFERDFGIWKIHVADGAALGEPSVIPITLRGAADRAEVRQVSVEQHASELALSPDGKKMALVVHGQIFAAPSDGSLATRVTHTDGIESHVTWAPDSRRLVYSSDREGVSHLFTYDFATQHEARLTDSPDADSWSSFSPHDRMLAFQRNGRQIRIRNISSGKERVLADNLALDRPPMDTTPSTMAWSPAGDWLAYVTTGPGGFNNVWVVPTATDDKTPSRQISFLPNCEGNSLCWAADGKFLLFGSGQRTEAFQLARIDLVPRTPQFPEDQFRDLFKPEEDQRPGRPRQQPSPRESKPNPASTQPATTEPDVAAASRHPTQIVFDDIDQRLELTPVGVGIEELAVSPDGKWLAFIGTMGRRQNVYLYSLDPASTNHSARQLTNSDDDKGFVQFRAEMVNGKRSASGIDFLEHGSIHSVNFDGQERLLPVKGEMEVDFDVEKRAVFNQAWSYLNDQFHDPHFNGAPWNEIRREYAPRVDAAKSPSEMRRLLLLMIGELNASHLGVGAPMESRPPGIGRLGIDFDPADCEQRGSLRVTNVIPMGPAAIAGMHAGDFVLSLNDVRLAPGINVDRLLEDQIDKQVTLETGATLADSHPARLHLKPVSSQLEAELRYREWVRSRREYVQQVSGGRLGYVHLADMSDDSLARLSMDLNTQERQCDGIIVDIRNNRGGFVNGYAIDVFARRNYITMIQRGFPAASGRSALGQNYLGRPTILLTNSQTLSDGEDFTEGYQALHLGKTVGEPTAGWIIFTNNLTLLDGTGFRLPHTDIRDHAGNPMEMHPRPVDSLVLRPAGENYTGQDIQLRKAADELLAQLMSRERHPEIQDH